MNIANFINIYTNIYIYIYIYIYILYMTRITNKSDWINSLLQHGHVAENNCSVVFPASGFPYLIPCPR